MAAHISFCDLRISDSAIPKYLTFILTNTYKLKMLPSILRTTFGLGDSFDLHGICELEYQGHLRICDLRINHYKFADLRTGTQKFADLRSRNVPKKLRTCDLRTKKNGYPPPPLPLFLSYLSVI